MTDDLPLDAVERVRAIRDRYYEETKHMTFEERWVYDKKKHDEFKKFTASIKPDPFRFPFLAKKKTEPAAT